MLYDLWRGRPCFFKAFHGSKHVELTDGDPIVVEALDEAVAKNHTNVSRMQFIVSWLSFLYCLSPRKGIGSKLGAVSFGSTLFSCSFTLVGLAHSFPTGFRVLPLLPLAFGIRRISLVFSGLPINRWCPSTPKILGFWFGYCCSLTFRGRYFLTGFLRFTHKPVVSQHPKNPGFLNLVIAPRWFSGDAFSLLVFCSLPINWVVSQHPKNPGFWFSAVYR